MSEAAQKRMKVSREGLVLIKSFEGFRARGVLREEGGWVIGYGHTRSAREGATVSEAEAELLLQYDLIPIVRTVSEHAGPDLNQHQFDALASFAFSVGADAFATSDVVRRLREGAKAEAADALVGWPQPLTPETALRRRAAERALFMAEPDTVVTLAQLLSAPLPPPAIEERQPFVPDPHDRPAPSRVETPPVNPRAAALAVLLGEAEPEPVIPDMSTFAPPAPPAEPEPIDASAQPDSVADHSVAHADQAQPQPDPAVTPTAAPSAPPPRPTPYAAANTNHSATILSGPLHGAVRLAPSDAELGSDPESEDASEDPAPAVAVSPSHDPARPDQVVEIPVESETIADPSDPDSAAPPPLVLTPAPESPFPPPVRAPWPDEQRFAESVAQDPLFEEGASGAVMRAEPEDQPARRGWNDTAPFAVMGGIGLVSFGAAMAAFRRAAQEDGGDIALIGWVLAVIALVCVGVSGFNLYQRLGRGGDAPDAGL